MEPWIDSFFSKICLKKTQIRLKETHRRLKETRRRLKEPRRLLKESRRRLKDMPIHHYFGVDYGLVWDIQENIPLLKEQVTQIIEAEQ